MSSTAVCPAAMVTAVAMPGMGVGTVLGAGVVLSGSVTARTFTTRPSHCVGVAGATDGVWPPETAPTATLTPTPTSTAQAAIAPTCHGFGLDLISLPSVAGRSQVTSGGRLP